MASLALIRSRPGAYTAEEEAAVVARSKLQLSIRLPPDPARPGKSGILRNPSTPNGPADYVSVAQNDPIKTVWQAWLAGVEAAGNGSGPCFGTRVPNGPYTWESYGDVHRRALALGTSLRRKCGLQPGSESSFVGIQLPNGSAWYSVDVACIAMNIVTLPLYTSADDDFSQHIITLGSLSVVFTAAVNVQQMVRLKKAGRVPTLKHIVVAGEPAKPREIEEGTAAGLVFHDYERLIAEGSVNPLPPAPATDPQAMFSIISTSGTTGTPKGSVLRHSNMRWIMRIGGDIFQEPTSSSDLFHSYLPSAHVGDRWFCWTVLSRGIPVSFGTAVDLFSDIQQSKPTIMGFVPRVLNRVVSQIKGMVEADGPAEQARFDAAYAAKRLLLVSKGVVSGDTEHDRPGGSFNRFRQLIGGRVKQWGIGAAAIDGGVLEFARVVFGVKIAELFGQTETTGMILSTGMENPYVPFGNSVGIPLLYTDVRLMDVPGLGYTVGDQPNPRGEICCRGPNAFAGYYREPDKTKETIDEDGFVMTGDVAELLPDGSFRIIDRSKNVFKMAQGEYVAPEKIEAVLLRSPWLAQAYVHGELLKRWLVAVLVPDPERVAAWANAKGRKGSLAELCKDPELVREVQVAIVETGRTNGLMGFEIPKAIALHDEPFTPESNLITPSFKNKRPQLKQRFADVVSNLYSTIPE